MSRTAEILAGCIHEVKSGRCTIEECLAKHPALADELRPLLLTAMELKPLGEVGASAEFRVQTRVRLMEEIHRQGSVTRPGWLRYLWWILHENPDRRPAMQVIAIALVLALVAMSGGAVYASQDATPGDQLYALKTGLEQTRLALTFGEMERAKLHLAFADGRLSEAVRMAEQGKTAGIAEAMQRYAGALAATTSIVESYAGRTEAEDNGKDLVELSDLLEENIGRHLTVLEERVLPRVPDSAQPAVQHAIEQSQHGLQTAQEAVQRGSPQGVSPTDVPPVTPPKGRPADVPPVTPPMSQPGMSAPNATPPVGQPMATPMATPQMGGMRR